MTKICRERKYKGGGGGGALKMSLNFKKRSIFLYEKTNEAELSSYS